MSEHKLVICTHNDGYEASLKLRKLYQVLPDQDAERHGQIRVIDESGEGYLYPGSCFTPVNLPQEIINRILRAA